MLKQKLLCSDVYSQKSTYFPLQVFWEREVLVIIWYMYEIKSQVLSFSSNKFFSNNPLKEDSVITEDLWSMEKAKIFPVIRT